MANLFEAIINPLKSLSETVQKLVELRDAGKIRNAVGEMNAHVIAAQQGTLAAHAAQTLLVDRVRELEEEIGRFEAWDVEKQRYELKQVYSGAFAYAVKPSAQGVEEPPHWLCTACYENRKKSILQAVGRDVADKSFALYKCAACAASIRVHYSTNPATAT